MIGREDLELLVGDLLLHNDGLNDLEEKRRPVRIFLPISRQFAGERTEIEGKRKDGRMGNLSDYPHAKAEVDRWSG